MAAARRSPGSPGRARPPPTAGRSKKREQAREQAEVPLSLKPVDKIPAFSRIRSADLKPPEVVENEQKKFVRRNKPVGEDMAKMKEIIRNMKNKPINVQEFIGLVAPTTHDNGETLRAVLAEELNNFRNTTRKVYETMTQDVSEVLTNEHIQMTENSKERHAIYMDRIQRNRNEIFAMCEDFDFDMFYNVENYLHFKFPLAPEVDMESEENQALIRQEAFHRYQWLKSEGERLKDENNRLQKRLAYLKRQQKNELQEVAQREQKAEDERQMLEETQEQLQDKLEVLNQSVDQTLVESEFNEAETVNLSTVGVRAKKVSKRSTRQMAFSQQEPEWAVQAAAEIETDATGQMLHAESSKISMRAMNSMAASARSNVTPQLVEGKTKRRAKAKRRDPGDFHFSPIKTPPRREQQRDEARAQSPFHYSPISTSPVAGRGGHTPADAAHASMRTPFDDNYAQQPPLPPPVSAEYVEFMAAPQVQVQTSSAVPKLQLPMRRGRPTAPRDTWGGFH